MFMNNCLEYLMINERSSGIYVMELKSYRSTDEGKNDQVKLAIIRVLQF